MEKSIPLLLTPGPVPIPDFVHDAMRQPVIQHRSQEFERLYEDFLRKVQYLFQTEGPVATMIGSGTAGVESAMYSLFRSKEKICVVNNGKFSQRWVAYGKLKELEVVEHSVEMGKVPSPADLVATLTQHPEVTGLVLTHCETSTGALLDVEEIAFAVKKLRPEITILVDAISTVGAIPFYLDEWNIDCVVTASQKALMNPAGVCLIGFRPGAEKKLKESHPGDYQNLHTYLTFAANNNYPFTPPLTLLYGLKAVLDRIHIETLPVVWSRTHQSAMTFRKGLKKIGGTVFAESPSDSLTSFSIKDTDLHGLHQQCLDAGYYLSHGQGELNGNILRVSHMGMATAEVMEGVLASI